MNSEATDGELPASGKARFVAETLALALAPVAWILAGNATHPELSLFGSPEFPRIPGAPEMPDTHAWELAAVYWVGALPFLLMCGMRRLSRFARLAVPAAIVAIVAGALHWTLPNLAEFDPAAPGFEPDPWFEVPLALVPLRSLSRFALPFAGGIFLAGRCLCPLRFLAGFCSVALALDAALTSRSPFASPAPALGAVLLAAVALLAVVLPGRRRALRGWLGLDESDRSGEFPFAFRALAIAALGCLGWGVALGVLAGEFERRMSEPKTWKPSPWRNPALVDAATGGSPYFRDRPVAFDPERCSVPPGAVPNCFAGYGPPAFHDPEIADAALAKTSPEKLAEYFACHAPLIEGFEAMRGADYCAPNYSSLDETPSPLWGNIRIAARVVAFRAVVRAAEGRPAEAARDVETVLAVGAILRREGPLVDFMIGSALVGIGNAAAYDCGLRWRDSPEDLTRLAGVMERFRPEVRRSIDARRLAGAEPMLGSPVLLVPDVLSAIAQPGYGRARDQVHLKWREFEFVLAMLKLELLRNERGSYPAALEELVPAFFDRIPRDPADGAPWIYRDLGHEFELTSEAHETHLAASNVARLSVRFPYSALLSPEERIQAANWEPEVEDE